MTETHTTEEKPAASQGTGTGKAGGAKPTTTFVQADSTCFRDVVQRLTGVGRVPLISHDEDQSNTTTTTATAKAAKKPTTFKKLHERRQLYSKSKLEIVKPMSTPQFPPSAAEVLLMSSPSPTCLYPSPLSNTSSSTGSSSNKRDHQSAASFLILSDHHLIINTAEEERAIKERRFYMHPSPRSKPGFIEPELLTLFPLTSPNSTTIHKA